MGVYDKVRSSKATGGGNWFEPDHDWVVMINEVKSIETRADYTAFIVECRVLQTDCEKVRSGAERSWFVDMTKDAAPGNVKHFIEVAHEQLTGEPLENIDCDACDATGKTGKITCPECDGEGKCSPIDEAGVLELCSERQPYAGLIIGLTTFNKPTREGNPFTRHKWTLIPEAQLKTYQDIAKKLGLGQKSESKDSKKGAQKESRAEQ